ncbi:MAG: hypothetical protein VCD00_00130 [Candidatus Hydrogenedentota bacterium]
MNLASFNGGSITKLLRPWALVLCAAVISSGCSGGGSSGSKPHNEELLLGVVDLDGNLQAHATQIVASQAIIGGKDFEGQEKVDYERFINYPGDVDFFRVSLVGGNTYGFHANFPQDNQSGQGDSSLLYSILDSTGSLTIPTTVELPYPGVIPDPDSNLRAIWFAPYTGNYYLRFQSQFAGGVGQYSFRIASSRLGVAMSRGYPSFGEPKFGGSVQNLRSYVLVIDDQENVRYNGPNLPNTAESVFKEPLFGSLDMGFLQIAAQTDGLVPPTFTLLFYGAGFSHDVSEVTFFDQDGMLQPNPETSAAHIHWGRPSSDLNDNVDDIFWNYDPGNGLPLGPVDNFAPNLNFEPGISHPFIEDVSGNIIGFSEELVHLMVGRHWYADAHITNDLDLYSVPIVSSHPQGGIRFFDSAFVLNGFDTVPQTGSPNTLEVVYNDEYQSFALLYDVEPPAGIGDAAIHVHTGRPGEEGPILIDLGLVPHFNARPRYEPAVDASGVFIPGVENIIKILTNDEAALLLEASYTTGWYLDVHTDPFFIVKPEIRANAVFFDQLEIASTHVNFPPPFDANTSSNSGVVRLTAPAKGKVSFISEDLAYGAIDVVLNGRGIGTIDTATVADDIVCGQEAPGGTVTGELAPNTYYFHAYGEGVMWDGHVSVDDGCAVVVLNADTAQIHLKN